MRASLRLRVENGQKSGIIPRCLKAKGDAQFFTALDAVFHERESAVSLSEFVARLSAPRGTLPNGCFLIVTPL